MYGQYPSLRAAWIRCTSSTGGKRVSICCSTWGDNDRPADEPEPSSDDGGVGGTIASLVGASLAGTSLVGTIATPLLTCKSSAASVMMVPGQTDRYNGGRLTVLACILVHNAIELKIRSSVGAAQGACGDRSTLFLILDRPPPDALKPLQSLQRLLFFLPFFLEVLFYQPDFPSGLSYPGVGGFCLL
jgi:hypothetical protein